MELRQLEYFVAIARMGGLRHAAEELSVSPGTLSEQLKYLERELAVRLFERSHRNLTLTDAGRRLLEHAEKALLELKTARAELLDFAQLERGQLIVGALPGLGPFWLSSFLVAFLKCHPNVDLKLIERSSQVLLKLLGGGDIQVGCVLLTADGHEVPPEVSVRRLTVSKLAVVVAPGHPLASQSAIRIEQLVHERLILTSPEETPRMIVDAAFRAAGCEPNVVFEANDPLTLMQLAAGGAGVGITGERIGLGQPEKVVTIPFAGEPLSYSLAMAWPAERGPHTRALEVFLSFVTSWWQTEFGTPIADAQH